MKLGLVTPSATTAGSGGRPGPNVRCVAPWCRLGLVLLALCVALVADAHVASAHAPHDDVADVAVSPTYAEDQTVFAIIRSRMMRSTDGGRTWAELVRGLGDGRQVLARIAVAPSDAQVIYVTTRGDGVQKSEDGGASWHAVNDGLTNLTLQEIAVSPTSPDIVVAAGAVGGGLFLTTDGGGSWSAIDGFGRVTSLGFLADGDRLLVGDNSGRVTTSDDAGETWTPVLTVDDGDAVSAVATGSGTASADIAFVATSSGRLFRSDDRGGSFDAVGDGLPGEDVRSLELSPDYARDGTLWASTWSTGVFRSTDEGRTWTPVTDGLTTDPQADEFDLPQFRTVAAGVDSTGDTALFAGGFDGLFHFDDRRGAWQPVETLADYIVGLAVSPDFADDETVAVTTYVKGAFMSNDQGETWRSANDGLTVDDAGAGNKFAPLRRLHDVVFSPDYANDGTIFSATWLRIIKSADRGASWSEIAVGTPAPDHELRQFVLAVSPSYASDQTVFAATRQGELFRSDGGGEAGTWSQVAQLAGRVRSLVVSPDYAEDGVLYAGTVDGVYVSTDRGTTWSASGPRMEIRAEGRETDPGALVAISPAYGADGTVFAGTDGGLFVTRDAGRSWAEVTAAPLAETSQIEAVAVSPDYENDRTLLVSTRDLGLVRSTDGGTSFDAVGAELLDSNLLVADFNNPTSAPIQFSPAFATDRTIFAYAQTDLVASTDGGDSWTVLRLPGGTDVLEGLRPSSSSPASGDERGWVETPVGHLSARRSLAAAVVALASFAALRALGMGGRRTRQALALHLGGGVVVLGVALAVLAA